MPYEPPCRGWGAWTGSCTPPGVSEHAAGMAHLGPDCTAGAAIDPGAGYPGNKTRENNHMRGTQRVLTRQGHCARVRPSHNHSRRGWRAHVQPSRPAALTLGRRARCASDVLEGTTDICALRGGSASCAVHGGPHSLRWATSDSHIMVVGHEAQVSAERTRQLTIACI
jgi:hypothetical protein